MAIENYETKEKKKLYRIGIFAQMNCVTVKTLHYYNDIGLLLPEEVDEISGYRYYTSSQMPKLHKILALKEIGFTILEIKKIFEGTSEKQLLLQKKNELLFEVANTYKKLASIESYLLGDYLQSEYRIIMKSLPEVNIASMRVHMNSYGELSSKMPAMNLMVEQANCKVSEPPYCFVIYYDGEYKENNIDAEICESITSLKEDQEHLKFRTLPMVEMAACVLHKGPYYNLPLAYNAIVKYIEENGYEIIDHQRESYIDGMWNKDKEEDWLTEIQFPVRKIQ